jgi:hypothetical protein
MMFFKNFICFFPLLVVSLTVQSQVSDNVKAGSDSSDKSKPYTYIQFSGVVLTSDSIVPIPFVNVTIKGKPYGDYSNFQGYYSFVAEKGDTVQFSHVEYANTYFVIPDSLHEFKYHVIQVLTRDTVYLPGTIITPVPTRSTFDYFFVNVEVPEDMEERAKKNLERDRIKRLAEVMGPDAYENYKSFVNQQNLRQYQQGTMPTITVMNPFAWAQFFEAWQRGDFKKKKKD